MQNHVHEEHQLNAYMASLDEITGTLGRTRAAHLLRRTTFGPTVSDINSFSTLNAAVAIERLMDDSDEGPAPPIDPVTGTTWVDPSGTSGSPRASDEREQEALFPFFKSWHMDVMRQSPATLKERITWFYHTHLPSRWTEILSSEAIYYQNGLFRHYAYGSFRELFRKICVDNAMLVYLDGHTNKKNAPNENFAREMFELYSIGKGPQVAEGDYTNYTEEDIRQATRVLTGWMFDDTFSNIDEDTGLPSGKLRSHMAGDGTTELATEHDAGQKTFTGKFGNQVIGPGEITEGYPTAEAAYAELESMIEMIFAQEETARFITRKIYRFFVYHFISEHVENEVIAPLATILRNNDYNISELLSVLLKSQHFYDEDDAVAANDNIGALIKSPVDLLNGLFRLFSITFPDRKTETTAFYNDMGYVTDRLVEQGLNFYEPFEVAGYPAYHQVPGFNRNWITTYALAHRYQAGAILMKKTDEASQRSFYLDIVEWVKNSGAIPDPSDPEAIMNVLLEHLFPVAITQERYDYFLYTVFIGFPDEDPAYARSLWTSAWNRYVGSGDDSEVRPLLEQLLSALIETPEFQIY